MVQRHTDPVIQPIPMPLFPTMETLDEAVGYIQSQVPITTRNQVTSLLMIYHNTLIKTLTPGI